MKSKFLLITLGIAVFLAAFIAVGRENKLNAGEWASWVQAVGSIIAIAAAFFLGQHQTDAALHAVHEAALIAEANRIKSILGMADFAESLASKCLEVFRTDGFNFVVREMLQEEDYLDGLNIAFNAIPIHEIGNASAVGAVLQLRSSAAHLERALARLDAATLPTASGGYANWQDVNTTVVRLCSENIQRASWRLRTAMLPE